jgi:hypothetical protein
MSGGLQKRFGFKRLTAILLLAVVVLVVFVLSVNGLFVSSADSSNKPVSSATSTPPPTTVSPTVVATATSSPTQIPIPVDFTCSYGDDIKKFSITVAVDLNDGMNRDEAVTVATAIIDHELANAKHELRIAEVTSTCDWHVGFNWEYNMIDTNGTILEPTLGHVFDVTINVANRTATYTRCM